jgi:hypothetical protein
MITGPRPAGVEASPITPDQMMTAPPSKAIAQAPISNLPVIPSRRRAAIHEVATK